MLNEWMNGMWVEALMGPMHLGAFDVTQSLELLSFLLLVKITCKSVTQLQISAFIYHIQ